MLSVLTNKILHLLDLGEEIIKQKDEAILQQVNEDLKVGAASEEQKMPDISMG